MVWTSFSGLSHYRMFSGVRVVFTLPPSFFSVQLVALNFQTQVDGMGWWNSTTAMNPKLFEIHAERSQNCHRFCKTLSQQKHFVLQSTAPLQLKRFKVGSKMAIAASAPVVPNQKKQCCKIARFTLRTLYYVYVSCTRITQVLFLFTVEHLDNNCMFYIFLLKRVLECK